MLATGRVLEIGIGSALNMPFYRAAVSEVIGVDPSPTLVGMARTQRANVPFKFDVLECSGEDVPLESRSVDTVLTTWSLCSVADPHRVLREARRLLRPGSLGDLLESPEGSLRICKFVGFEEAQWLFRMPHHTGAPRLVSTAALRCS